MLKFIYSFYRYSKLTCENINITITHVRTYCNLNHGRKACVTFYAQHPIADSFTHRYQQLRLLASIKKRSRLKLPQNSTGVAQATKQMNNKFLPSVAYVSQGGEFNVEDENSMDWDAIHPSTSSRRSINKRRDTIPRDFRRWERVGSKGDGTPFRFKVVSYNVLAQYLLEGHPYLYTYCDPQDLKWKIRSERIFKEIMALDPDVICLQEVQSSHLKSFFVRFEQVGYYGIFKQKTGQRGDGCAIYYKREVFDLDDHITVEYYQPDMLLLNRDNVGLILKLRPRECPTTAIVVATTHLLYNPKRADVRLGQMQVLLAELDRFAYYEENNGKDTGYLPIVLTGDFNSSPESAVIKLLDNGEVSGIGQRDCWDWRRVAITDNCQHLSVHLNRPRGVVCDYSMLRLHNSEMARRDTAAGSSAASAPAASALGPRQPVALDQQIVRHNMLFNSSKLTYPLKLVSVYPHVKPNNIEEATTFQDYWGTVDYIYFSCCNKLRLLQRLRLPTKLECEVLGCLPNDVFGSDHLMLAAYFELRDHKPAN